MLCHDGEHVWWGMAYYVCATILFCVTDHRCVTMQSLPSRLIVIYTFEIGDLTESVNRVVNTNNAWKEQSIQPTVLLSHLHFESVLTTHLSYGTVKYSNLCSGDFLLEILYSTDHI